MPAPHHRHVITRFLVDLAMHRDGLNQLLVAEPSAHHELLYLQTDHKRVADAGPLLIEPSLSDACAICRKWTEQGLAIELQGTRPFSDIAAHLRTLTMVEFGQAPPALFRYADSRLYAGLQAVLGEHERTRLLGPNERLSGVAANEAWTLCQSPANADQHEPSTEPFRLAPQHRQALQDWRERAFLQPLAAQHGISLERVRGWFQQLAAMGFNSEKIRFESCRRLASLGIDQPIPDALVAAIQAQQAPCQAKLAALEAQLASDSKIRQGE